MHLQLLLPSQDGCFDISTCALVKLVHLWNTAGHLSPHGEVCVKTRGARKINKIVTSFCPPARFIACVKQTEYKQIFFCHILKTRIIFWDKKLLHFSGACVSLDSLACWDFLKDEHLDERTIGSPLLFKHPHQIYDLVPEYTPNAIIFLFPFFNI